MDSDPHLYHEGTGRMTRYNDRFNRTNYGSGRDSHAYGRTVLEPLRPRPWWSVALSLFGAFVALMVFVGVAAYLF